jgi:hypothetical protein
MPLPEKEIKRWQLLSFTFQKDSSFRKNRFFPAKGREMRFYPESNLVFCQKNQIGFRINFLSPCCADRRESFAE